MKILPIYEGLEDGHWEHGVYLDSDQIISISASPYGHRERYRYNKKIDKFIHVIQMDNYDIDDFNVSRHDLPKAKERAREQELDYENLEIGRIRVKM